MTAIFALTRRAVHLSLRLKDNLPEATIFLPERFREEYPGCSYIYGSFPDTVAAEWQNYRRFIFIMAAGIVVRSLAPLLQGKEEDPAVVVLDEEGKFAVPILSGHGGGANDLARELAGFLGGTPVLTTASDVRGFSALDDVARKNKCRLARGSDWKALAGLILEGRPVGLVSTVTHCLKFPENVVEWGFIPSHPVPDFSPEGMIFLTEYVPEKLSDQFLQQHSGNFSGTEIKSTTLRYSLSGRVLTLPRVVLHPRNLIVGVGCKKGKSKEEILAAITTVLGDLGLSLDSIACLASAEIKKDEPGLNSAAAELGVPFAWSGMEAIAAIADQFAFSGFVKEAVGVGAVAAPAAWLHSVKPQLVAEKRKLSGVTVAVVKDMAVEIRD